ncbi:hypothetical protein R1flu_010788 [Riccia fluitans]|uniref:ABC transporter domain-containing protein n=1 Tax=Riccia fluitans TaxID=41844 RepID=A0ABD1Z6A7_9MARC
MAESMTADGNVWFDRERGGSRVWGDTGEGKNPFARRSSLEVDEDDFEDLMEAALERLPTRKRMYTAILDQNLISSGSAGSGVNGTVEDPVRMDIRKLNKYQRSRMVDHAFRTREQDNALLLREIQERLDRARIQLPTVEVRFEDLDITADIHVGSRALPSLPNFFFNLIEDFLSKTKILQPRKQKFPILNGVSGVVRPGRMTLLLGPPGSGKTTLLKALAAKMDRSIKATGNITYNGRELDTFIPQRTSAYISQLDNHIGELTVRETLDFSAQVQGSGYRSEMMIELARREKAQGIKPSPVIDAFMKGVALEGKKHSFQTDYILKVLGLEICADILVGNNMVRGISGGQKKRVTSGEMLVGPKKTLFADEISTGLDSSTTFQIVKCLRNFTHLLQGTILMALLQPAPETFNLFDDVLLLAEGHVVYYGPRENVVEYFEKLGFQLPPRKGVADFLQEVTSRKDQRQYWADARKPYEFIPVAQLARAFKEHKLGRDVRNYLAVPFDPSTGHPSALVTKNFALGQWDMFSSCFSREYLLMKRNRFLYIFRTCQVAFVAFVTGTLFLRTRLHPTDEANGSLYLGTLFYALIHMMFNGFSEISITIARLPVFYKQRDNRFYPVWAFVAPNWVLRLPYSFVEAVIWSSIVYWLVGLAPSAGRFFRYTLLLFMMHQMALGLFRLIASVGRSMTVANTFGSFCLLVAFLLGGFVLSKDNIPVWWVWGFWISPLSYAQNAIAVNEFLDSRWRKMSPTSGQPLYLDILRGRGLSTQPFWYWLGIAALFGFAILFNLLVVLALKYLNPFDKPQATLPEESLREKAVARDGEEAVSGPSVKLEMSRLNDTSRSGSADGKQETQTVDGGTVDSSEGVVSQEHMGSKKGMILPFRPLALTFHNVCYYVDMPPEMKREGVESNRLQLLRNVSGAFRPKVLTALVGVSGAGKTTLMDVLAGRKTGGYIEGDIRVSGFEKKQETFARISGYVEQTDIHSPQVTVYESLIYSAWLRLPSSVDTETREKFVGEIMELVELKSLHQSLVGLPGTTGLSTEQRKRLTIAVELVSNPSIIFMDEPTSGLDARAAAIVMRTVRNTVDTGRTVVCTIHQPSIDIFEAFDELLLMKRGGQVSYAGPLGSESRDLVRYFQAIPGIEPISEGYNPATWMLEITTPAKEEELNQDFADIYRNSELFRKNEKLIEDLSVPAAGAEDIKFPTVYSRNGLTQFWACIWKQNITYWRSPSYNAVRFSFTAVCALIFGSIYFNLGSKRDTQQDIFNVMGALYSAVIFLGVNNASTVQPVVAVERTVFYRERAAGMYSSIPYAVAQGLIEVPYIFTQTAVYSLITYSLIHFEWTAAKFFWYFLYMFLTFIYFTFYGMMAVGLTPSQQLAAVISSFFYSIWNLFSGFLIPRPRIPPWWVWYYWLSPVAWTLYGLISSQLGDVKTTITQAGGVTVTVEEFIESYFGYNHDWLGYIAAGLIAFGLVFWGIFVFSIKFLHFQKR